MSTPESEIIKTSCRLCYNGCGVLVRLEDGRPVSVKGDPDHPLSRGTLCRRGRAALQVMNHPDRLRHPVRQKGARGSGDWERISWDEALDATMQGLNRIRDQLGPESVIFMRGGSKGTSDDHLTRLANIFGSPNVSTTSSVCYSPCGLSSKHTYGFWAYPDMEHPPRCILLWGFNPTATHHPMQRELVEARGAGAKLVTIDPCYNEQKADLVLKPRPGTDGHLAMAMACAIVEEGLQDQDFLDRWATGFARLSNHLKKFSPETMAEVTRVPAQDIRRAARLYATVRPGCILWGNALEAGPDNYQTCRAICILRALTGNIGAPGGDILWSRDGELHRRSPAFTRPDLLPEAVARRSLSVMGGLLPDFPYAPHNFVARAIVEDEPYPVRALLLMGGNLLCTSPNAGYMCKALGKLDFFAASEHFMTPTTALADIVFPSSMYLEHDGVEQPWHWPMAFLQQRASDPGETRSESEICNDLARRVGHGEYAFSRMREFLDFYLEPAGLDFDQFRTRGVICGQGRPLAHEKEGFPTPSGKIELYSSFLKQHGFSALPDFKGPIETSAEYPLVMTNRKSKNFYHSCGRQIPSLREHSPKPETLIHPDTAQEYGLSDGGTVKIITSKGTIRQKVRLDPHLSPGVIMPEHGWWFPEEGADEQFGWQRANMNILTTANEFCGRELGGAALKGVPCRVEPDEETMP